MFVLCETEGNVKLFNVGRSPAARIEGEQPRDEHSMAAASRRLKWVAGEDSCGCVQGARVAGVQTGHSPGQSAKDAPPPPPSTHTHINKPTLNSALKNKLIKQGGRSITTKH